MVLSFKRGTLLLALVFFTSIKLVAQIGLRTSYINFEAPEFELSQQGDNFLNPPGHGLALSLDYRLKMQNLRVEVRPEIQWASPQTVTNGNIGTKSRYIGLWSNVVIFPFDLRGDCDCPTFGRNGNPLQKAFFIEAAPGLYHTTNTIEISRSPDDIITENQSFAFGFSIGIGLEMKINRNFAFSPYAKTSFFPKMRWPSLQDAAALENLNEVKENSSVTGIQAGIRFGFR